MEFKENHLAHLNDNFVASEWCGKSVLLAVLGKYLQNCVLAGTFFGKNRLSIQRPALEG